LIVLNRILIAGAVWPLLTVLPTQTAALPLTGYYPDYQYAKEHPSELPFEVLDCIEHFSLTPKNDGGLQGIAPARMSEMAALAPCAQIVIGGPGRSAGFRSGPMATLVQNIVSVVETHGYDGVDIDWEPLDNRDDEGTAGMGAGRWQPFIRALSQALPSDVRLSIAVGYPHRSSKDTLLEQMVGDVAPLVDEVILMAYGMSGPWPGWVTWPGSALSNKRSGVAITFPGSAKPLPSVEEIVARYASAGVPRGKMTLGLAAFGHQWHGASQPLQPVAGVTRGGEFQYKRIVSYFSSYPARCWALIKPLAKHGLCRDRYALVPYLWHDDPARTPAKLYFPFEDQASWRAKRGWAEQRGLGGLAVWEVTGDLTPDGGHPLLQVLR
jgi:chitinase